MSDHASPGLSDGLEDRVTIPRQDGDHVDHLARHPQLLLSQLGDLAQDVYLGTPSDQGDIIT